MVLKLMGTSIKELDEIIRNFAEKLKIKIIIQFFDEDIW